MEVTRIGRTSPVRVVGSFICATALVWTALSGVAGASPARLLKAVQGTAREEAAAAPLPNGKVLIVGGDNKGPLNTAELYNPAMEAFEPLAPKMTSARDGAIAAPLPNGKVLIAGGYNGSAYTGSAELYNPKNETFESLPASEQEARWGAAAIPLANGNVLIVGGYDNGTYYKTAEIFNVGTETFSKVTSPLLSTRGEYPAIARYAPGKILISGGYADEYLSSAEVFNEENSTFEPLANNASQFRGDYGATAFTLQNGVPIIAGGYAYGGYLNSVEQFSASTLKFTLAPWSLVEARWAPGYAPINDGKEYLISGGEGESNTPLSSAEAISEPQAGATITGYYFGDEFIGESSAAQAIMVSSVGFGPLLIHAIKISGPGAADYKVFEDNCSGKVVEPGSSCGLLIYFTPGAAGEAKATVSVEGNESPSVTAALVGTGVAGPAGPTGASGPTGATGATGPAGKPAKPAVRRCKLIKKRVKRHNRVTVRRVRVCQAKHAGKRDHRRGHRRAALRRRQAERRRRS